MQILGLLCMYFDAVVVDVKINQIGSGHTVQNERSYIRAPYFYETFTPSLVIQNCYISQEL